MHPPAAGRGILHVWCGRPRPPAAVRVRGSSGSHYVGSGRWRMMTSNSRLMLALQAILFAACGRSSPATCDSGLTAPGCNRPATILTAVTPDSAAISVGETIRIKDSVTYNPTDAAYALSWVSSDSATASVDSTGLVTGLAASPQVLIWRVRARIRGYRRELRNADNHTRPPASRKHPGHGLSRITRITLKTLQTEIRGDPRQPAANAVRSRN